MSPAAVHRLCQCSSVVVAGRCHRRRGRLPPDPAARPGVPRCRPTSSAEAVRRRPVSCPSARRADRLSGRALLLVVLAGRDGQDAPW